MLIERNKKHFAAHGTPFTVPLLSKTGYHGTSESANTILRDELPPNELAMHVARHN
jgi:hypothetical protein